MERTIQTTETTYWLWPLEGGWGLLPLAAVAGGAWAFADTPDASRLAAALGLVLAGWIPLWRALTGTDWATSLRSWQTWEKESPLPSWPYLQPHTPGAALHRALSRADAWWKEAGSTELRTPVQAALLALGISLLAGLALGRMALLFTLLLLTLIEMALLWREDRPKTGPGWEALVGVGLPWLLGASLGSAPLDWPVLSGLGLSFIVALAARPSRWLLLPFGLQALLLIQAGHPFAAGLTLLLAFPPLLLHSTGTFTDSYRKKVAPWLLAAILLTTLVL